MHRSWHRPVLTLLAALAIATSGAVVLSAPAEAAISDIKVNEVESNGGTPGDWVELKNTGATPVDIGGLKFKDGDDTHAFYVIPSPTIVLAGGYYVLEEAAFGFGLGTNDSARLFQSDGLTIVDSYAWGPHAASTYGRCPDGTGAFGDTTSTKAAANNCVVPPPSVKINEIESSGGTPADWVELVNTGASSADISGLKVKDNDDGHVYTIPAATSVAAGAYYVIEQAQLGFELDDADAVRLFATDGSTSLDSYTWATPAATSYGRCPDTTGAISATQLVTKGTKNNCPGDLITDPWPGGSTVTTVDETALATSNMSGLFYQGTGTTTPGTLWAVRNGGPEALYKLVKSGSNWVTDTGWTGGKQLRYTGGAGVGEGDALGVGLPGAAGGVFVATERDNANNGVSRPAILRFDPTAAGSELTATGDWNLTPDLPGLGPNLGLEAITWVPDSYLTAKGFKTSGGTAYNPANYANHGTGLFFVGVEQNGAVYAYALNLSSNTFTQVATFASGFPGVMELHFEKETQKLWVVCDDTCQGRSARFDVETAAGANQGKFVPVKYYERPSGMGNLNNEGFTSTPRSECVGGVKPVFWADDSDTGGNSLRVGTLNCTVPVAQTVSFTSNAPGSPVVGQTYTPTATGGASGNPVVISIAAGSATVCSITAGVVRFNHPGSCAIKADQAGNDDFTAGTAQQTMTVAKAATATSFQITASTIRAAVTPMSPGAGTPTGNVTFKVDGAAVQTVALSGGTATISQTIPSGSTHTVAVDYAGDGDFLASTKSGGRTDPQITAVVTSQGEEKSPAGWYHTPVTVTFSCTPQGSPLAGGCPAPVVLTASAADQVVTRTVSAEDGGAASVTVSNLDIDLVGPAAAIVGVEAGKAYKKLQHPTCAGTDALSGFASCTINQIQDGRKVLVLATAFDKAGNATTTELTYKIKKKKHG